MDFRRRWLAGAVPLRKQRDFLFLTAEISFSKKEDPGMLEKKGILVVSYGTTHLKACQENIEACEKAIAEAFPGYEVRRAFTSAMVRKVLRERDGLPVDDTKQALDRMREEGFVEVIVQSLHIIPGEEYHEKVLRPVEHRRDIFTKLTVGRPLLTTLIDYREAVSALKWQLPKLTPDHGVLLMGHGSSHPANACYSCLQLLLNDMLPGVFMATVEGFPELGDVIPRLKRQGLRRVTLMPYMLVAGDHVQNDMAGENEDSWKCVLEKEGFQVDLYMHGLGENPLYRDIYVERVRECLGKEAAR